MSEPGRVQPAHDPLCDSRRDSESGPYLPCSCALGRTPSAIVFPRGYTETRFVVFSYRSECRWWERVASYASQEEAQKHADAISARPNCAAVLGRATIRHDDVVAVSAPARVHPEVNP